MLYLIFIFMSVFFLILFISFIYLLQKNLIITSKFYQICMNHFIHFLKNIYLLIVTFRSTMIWCISWLFAHFKNNKLVNFLNYFIRLVFNVNENESLIQILLVVYFNVIMMIVLQEIRCKIYKKIHILLKSDCNILL